MNLRVTNRPKLTEMSADKIVLLADSATRDCMWSDTELNVFNLLQYSYNYFRIIELLH